MSERKGHPGIDDPELLAQVLSRHDVSCPVCRYNLRGAQSAKCPECGAALDLRIGAADHRTGRLVVILISACLPLGFFVPFSFIWLWVVLADVISMNPAAWWVPALIWSITLLLSINLAALIRGRRRFLSASPAQQSAVAGVTLLIGGLSCLILLYLFAMFFP